MLEDLLQRTRSYLTNHLLPFWTARIVEPEYGGFQTNYDRNGRRTAVTEKTLLCQARALFTLSHACRMGYAWDGAEAMLQQGVDFLENAFRDRTHDGYAWIVDEQGHPLDSRKVIYGHSFLIYGFAEYALLTGDDEAGRRARALFDLVMSRAADLSNGGFFEHFDRAFNREAVRPDGIHHKSLDVHMHLMEAFTTLYELTGEAHHRQALESVIELIFERMIDRETGCGVAMFRADWVPLANVQLDTLWGSDRFDPAGKPPQITSYGHNIELAWLYLHALDSLGVDRASAAPRVLPIFRHTRDHGVDWTHGGLFVEGERTGEATETTKEFWQQAEALVGFLDAAMLTGDPSYVDAFRAIHSFVFDHMINWDQGEWFPLLARDGSVLWDYMGHNWKICYHTIRGMVEVVRRLERITRDAEQRRPPNKEIRG